PARRGVVPGEHGGEHGVGADHVFEVVHGALPTDARAQSLPASRPRLSARARCSSDPANQNLVATTITHSGQAIEASSVDSPNIRIVAPWCSEFHQVTE